ncbi:Pentatricopeptide repeat-containing protein [Glycine soja]|uniref:Pentatricopeptide repeat-containing protein n=1 Tax=Glycine soja TaxID=3848 RepID=A0A0B2Q8A5_GLYSO|nr:Pentatricopeptide repeat-containing protein [Glycine soja]
MALFGRGTVAAIRRSALIFTSNSNKSLFRSHPFSAPISLNVSNSNAIHRHFSSTKKPVDTKVNFSLSDTDDEDNKENGTSKKAVPPPYDPFSKKPAVEDPSSDPKDLQQIFHNMRTGDGLFSHAVKMFDALSKEGLTHEALELFAQIKDKGHMPDVVAHSTVPVVYTNAGLAAAADVKFVKEASKYVLEMMDKGMKPNVQTYACVFEGLVREEKLDEAARLLEQMKGKGFVPDEKAVREVLASKRGPVFRNVIDVLFGK